MPITQDDVRLFAALRMTDFSDGGGRMSTVVIVDGQDNNVFPDVTDLERLTGKVSLRKLHPAAINNDSDAYLSAHVLLDDTPDDPACTAFLFLSNGYTSERPSAVDVVLDRDIVVAPTPTTFAGDAEAGTRNLWIDTAPTLAPAAAPWRIQAVSSGPLNALRFPLLGETVTEPLSGTPRGRYVMNKPFPGASGYTRVGVEVHTALDFRSASAYRLYGTAEVLAAASVGATTIDVEDICVRVAPLAEAATALSAVPGPTAEPYAAWNLAPASATSSLSGQVWSLTNSIVAMMGDRQILHPNTAILIHDTARLAPQAVANGQTVSAGRTSLSRLRVIGADGVEIARFVRNAAVPTGVGCTANLDAGTVTFSNVAGMTQPVTVEHRIEEMSTLISYAPIAGGYRLTLPAGRPLTRAYPATARVSSLLSLGDLQGRALAGFAQSAWTGVFQDSPIGGTPSADYDDVNYPVLCTNKGAITERWAIEFTSSTAYRVWGEKMGLIGVGNTTTDFAPNNPATSAPYFTIRALGWGLGWSPGNAYRFNTFGANASVWVGRSVRPSTAFGDDSVTAELRGFVNV